MKSTLKVLEEIENLKVTGKIDEKTYQKLKKAIEEPIELDIGKIFVKYRVSDAKNVLDVAAGGSGTGPKVLGRKVIALDISKEEIVSAIKDGALAQWICADARRLPFKANSIDLIITFVGLAYISNSQGKLITLKEAYRVLKKSGLLLLIEPEIAEECREFIQYFIIYNNGVKINETILGVSGGKITQSKESLIRLLEDTGFKTEAEYANKILVIAGKK